MLVRRSSSAAQAVNDDDEMIIGNRRVNNSTLRGAAIDKEQAVAIAISHQASNRHPPLRFRRRQLKADLIEVTVQLCDSLNLSTEHACTPNEVSIFRSPWACCIFATGRPISTTCTGVYHMSFPVMLETQQSNVRRIDTTTSLTCVTSNV